MKVRNYYKIKHRIATLEGTSVAAESKGSEVFTHLFFIRYISHVILLLQGIDIAGFGRTISLHSKGKDFTAVFFSTIIKMGIGIHTVPNVNAFTCGFKLKIVKLVSAFPAIQSSSFV